MTENTSISGSRIMLLDTIRGYAITGILFCHFTKWHVSPFLDSMERKDFSKLSNIVLTLNAIFLTDKFLILFSFIFGISFCLQTVSFEKYTQNVNLWLVRRSIVLFLIGAIHYLFWFGDILSVYAVLMLPVIFLRKLNNKLLILTGLFFVFNIPGILQLLYHANDVKSTPGLHQTVSVDPRVAKLYQVVTQGNLFDNVKFNLSFVHGRIQYLLWNGTLSLILGFFCFGIYVARQKLLLKAAMYKRKYPFLIIAGIVLLVGIRYAIVYTMSPENAGVPGFKLLHSVLFSLQSIVGVVTNLSIVAALSMSNAASIITKNLANLGRMALTNYLVHTFIGLSLFYYAGLGLFVVTTPAMNVCIAMLVIVFQMLFCNFWLRYFNYGPVEYLLRAGTTWKLVPLKKKVVNT